jgi:hypothetical protein
MCINPYDEEISVMEGDRRGDDVSGKTDFAGKTLTNVAGLNAHNPTLRRIVG